MEKFMQKSQKRLSQFLIGGIKLYQKKAPNRIRSACRFEPTCSNYMHIAVEKYGAYKGFVLGLKRLLRCRIPNGGIDYP